MQTVLKVIGGLAVVVISFVVTDRALDYVWPRCPAGERLELKRPFVRIEGRSFYAPLPPAFESFADTSSEPKRSSLVLCEGSSPLGPAHALHADIAAKGGGRFSHWLSQIIFSSSDGSDPNQNAYTYIAVTAMTTPVRGNRLSQD